MPWAIAAVAVLGAAGAAVAITMPFTSAGAGSPVADNTDAAGLYTVTRQDLSSQTQVSATLGYGGAFSIVAPSGTSAQDVSQAQETVTGDKQALSADERYESNQSTADDNAIAMSQAIVNADQSTLSADQAAESQACGGSGGAALGTGSLMSGAAGNPSPSPSPSTGPPSASPSPSPSTGPPPPSPSPSTGPSSAACTQDEQKVSGDQTALNQARQQLAAAQSTATLDHDQNQAKVQADETTLRGDQATLASLRTTEVNPGTSYTWLPTAGELIREDQRVYSLSDEPVPLLYGSIPAYRAFYVGMSDGADVGELTRDLIALGFGGGLAQGNHYSAATAAAVERWQEKLGLPATGEILLGEVVFEPGPIRVASVTPAVGESLGGGGGGSGTTGSGGGGGGGGTVLSATSTARSVSIALDASQQSEVAVGDKVTITLPDNATTPGVISSVGTVATSSPSSSSSSSSGSGSASSGPTITVLVNPTDPAATRTWDEAPVTVTITTGTVSNALVVPVTALRARPGGGYAVEVAGADGARHLVAVTVGLFDDATDQVQVTGTGLAAGQQVVGPPNL